jgi:hypothetical protein
MGIPNTAASRRPRRQLTLRAMGVALLCLASLPAFAGGTRTLYLYRENGMPVYTDRKPEGRIYSELRLGRPTASASCVGLSEKVLQERANYFQKIVSKHAKKHAVPAGLVRAVIKVESCVGARGLMQLMPATASELGVKNAFDAEQNIEGGVRYLSKMLARFNNDTRLAVAAYNAGPQAVARHKGIPPYAETQRYVERVLAAYREVGGKRNTAPAAGATSG